MREERDLKVLVLVLVSGAIAGMGVSEPESDSASSP